MTQLRRDDFLGRSVARDRARGVTLWAVLRRPDCHLQITTAPDLLLRVMAVARLRTVGDATAMASIWPFRIPQTCSDSALAAVLALPRDQWLGDDLPGATFDDILAVFDTPYLVHTRVRQRRD
jgi:hypothetical protein